MHTGLSIAELAAGGMLPPHVHSYEESFYLLSGQVVLSANDQSYRLGPGDYGCLKVGCAARLADGRIVRGTLAANGGTTAETTGDGTRYVFQEAGRIPADAPPLI